MTMDRNDDDRYNGFGSGPNAIIKIIIFALVGMIVITSVALPMLATIGERTVTYSNSGIRVINVWEEYDSLLSGYDTDTTEIIWNSEGIWIGGEISGNENKVLILPKNELVIGPAIIIQSTGSGWLVEYNGENYTYITRGNSITLDNGILNIFSDDSVYSQDPSGGLILSDKMYAENLSDVIGFSMTTTYMLWVKNTAATLYVTGEGLSYGSAVFDSDEIDDFYKIEDISYNDYDCQYMIGEEFSYTDTEDMLAGTNIGGLISTIPLLMIIGIVVFVARNMRGSDR